MNKTRKMCKKNWQHHPIIFTIFAMVSTIKIAFVFFAHLVCFMHRFMCISIVLCAQITKKWNERAVQKKKKAVERKRRKKLLLQVHKEAPANAVSYRKLQIHLRIQNLIHTLHKITTSLRHCKQLTRYLSLASSLSVLVCVCFFFVCSCAMKLISQICRILNWVFQLVNFCNTHSHFLFNVFYSWDRVEIAGGKNVEGFFFLMYTIQRVTNELRVYTYSLIRSLFLSLLVSSIYLKTSK